MQKAENAVPQFPALSLDHEKIIMREHRRADERCELHGGTRS